WRGGHRMLKTPSSRLMMAKTPTARAGKPPRPQRPPAARAVKPRQARRPAAAKVAKTPKKPTKQPLEKTAGMPTPLRPKSADAKVARPTPPAARKARIRTAINPRMKPLLDDNRCVYHYCNQ